MLHTFFGKTSMARLAATKDTISPQSSGPSLEQTSLLEALFGPTNTASSSGSVLVEQWDHKAWSRGACPTCSTTAPHSDGCASLSSVLVTEHPIPEKFWLSAKARVGILRRATKREKSLPPALEAALKAV